MTLVRVSSCVQSVASYIFSFISQSRTRNLPGRKSQQAVPLKTKRNKKKHQQQHSNAPCFYVHCSRFLSLLFFSFSRVRSVSICCSFFTDDRPRRNTHFLTNVGERRESRSRSQPITKSRTWMFARAVRLFLAASQPTTVSLFYFLFRIFLDLSRRPLREEPIKKMRRAKAPPPPYPKLRRVAQRSRLFPYFVSRRPPLPTFSAIRTPFAQQQTLRVRGAH